MKEYVLGFAFSINGSKKVALIEKDRPDWQKGKLNGIGGKIDYDQDSTPLVAMQREFKEETGVSILSWTHFATMEFKNDMLGGHARIYCFKTFTNRVYDCQTMESEKVILVPVDEVQSRLTVANLSLLIPLALSTEFTFTKLVG